MFNAKVQLEFRGATITSDAGLLAYRELDEALALTRMGLVSGLQWELTRGFGENRLVTNKNRESKWGIPV